MNGRTNPTPAAEAAAERELLQLCFVHAKDAAWAQWFYECCFTHPQGKVAGLTFAARNAAKTHCIPLTQPTPIAGQDQTVVSAASAVALRSNA